MLPGSDRPAWRVLATVVGVALVAGAIWFALGGLPRRGDLWALLAGADPWIAFALLAVIAAHLAATSLVFWVVTLSFDARPRVGLGRMAELIAASSLLNYLPLRPGMIGRAGFLRLCHGLPLRQSVWITLVVLALGAAVPVAAVLIAVAVPEGWRALTGLGGCAAAAAATRPLAAALLRRPVVAAWAWVPLRTLELLLTGVRFWLAFRLVGHPIPFTEALIVGAAGFFVNLVGLTPNGLGLREWAVAATATLVQTASGPAGVLAALADRAVEAIVFTVTGLWSLARLRRAVPR